MDDTALRAEAAALHRALFGRDAPDEIARLYAEAHASALTRVTDAERQWMLRAAGADLEALEIAVRPESAGTRAPWTLRGTRTLVLDEDHRPPETRPERNLYDLRKARPLLAETIGPRFESLHNLENPELSPKVKAPLLRHVIEK